jgi:hypothetical protein
MEKWALLCDEKIEPLADEVTMDVSSVGTQ